MPRRPQLSQAERDFLEAWMWEEAHAQDISAGSAKRLQIANSPYAAPLLADIASATMSPEEQVAVANRPKPGSVPSWPWRSDEELRARHHEARTWLEKCRAALAGAHPK